MEGHMRASSVGSYPHVHPKPAAGRWLCAVALSVLVHAWLAWEGPAGSPRPGSAGYPALSVRIAAPDAQHTDDGVASAEAVLGHRPGMHETRAAPPMRKTAPHSPVAAVPADAQRLADGAAGNASIAPYVDTTYYPARQLDVYPAPLEPLAIRYPERALHENKAGRALVMLLIDAYGKVDDVAIVEAEPAGYFEDAAVKTFEHVRFTAARRNGMPVRSRVLIHLNFDPAERAAVAH